MVTSPCARAPVAAAARTPNASAPAGRPVEIGAICLLPFRFWPPAPPRTAKDFGLGKAKSTSVERAQVRVVPSTPTSSHQSGRAFIRPEVPFAQGLYRTGGRFGCPSQHSVRLSLLCLRKRPRFSALLARLLYLWYRFFWRG